MGKANRLSAATTAMLLNLIRKRFREEPGLAQQASPGAAAALRAHGQGGYFVSASGVSAPPYGRQEPSEVVGEQLQFRGAVPIPAARDPGHRPTFPQQLNPRCPAWLMPEGADGVNAKAHHSLLRRRTGPGAPIMSLASAWQSF